MRHRRSSPTAAGPGPDRTHRAPRLQTTTNELTTAQQNAKAYQEEVNKLKEQKKKVDNDLSDTLVNHLYATGMLCQIYKSWPMYMQDVEDTYELILDKWKLLCIHLQEHQQLMDQQRQMLLTESDARTKLLIEETAYWYDILETREQDVKLSEDTALSRRPCIESTQAQHALHTGPVRYANRSWSHQQMTNAMKDNMQNAITQNLELVSQLTAREKELVRDHACAYGVSTVPEETKLSMRHQRGRFDVENKENTERADILGNNNDDLMDHMISTHRSGPTRPWGVNAVVAQGGGGFEGAV